MEDYRNNFDGFVGNTPVLTHKLGANLIAVGLMKSKAINEGLVVAEPVELALS